MPRSQIGCLVHVNKNVEEATSLPKISLFYGPNFIGRNDVSIPDKRLSRKHIALTTSPDGSADLLVEGTNPVVVRFGELRKKLGSCENRAIGNGDIIELIPGHHFFKYVSSSTGETKRSFIEANGDEKIEGLTAKRMQNQGSEDKASSAKKLKGDVILAVLSNYMVDVDWLMSACLKLAKIPRVFVIHGEGDSRLDHMKRNKPSNWILHKPPLPISFGTHHSKAMLLVYPQGVRVTVHTANLIYVDWNNNSQGLWMQDFPWKDQNNSKKGCGLENDLFDYLSTLKWPEFTANLPALGSFNINSSFFKKFDYSNARFSSLGSLDEIWMVELASSMSSGYSEDKTPLGLGGPSIIWPSVEDVRCSLEGYAAGNAIPSPLKNVEKGFLKKYWAKWKASHTGRCRARPHIKTYTHYKRQKLAWFLLTSANLSKAAWGALQKNNSQLMIRSFELGVLFLPSYVKEESGEFSCTGDGGSSNVISIGNSEVTKTKLVTLAWEGSKTSKVIPLPVPYELPTEPYSSEDVPCCWDRRFNEKDVYGQVWTRRGQL